MRIGLSVKPLINYDLSPKAIDGIGTYTKNLMQLAGFAPGNAIVKIYFKSMLNSCKKLNTEYKNDVILHKSALLGQYIGNTKALEDNLDLLHITDYQVPKLKNKPVIATIHDAIMLKNPEFCAASSLISLKNYCLRQLVANADHVITISNAMVSDMLDYWHIPAHKIHVIYPGIEHSWLQPICHTSKQMVLQKYNINKPFFLVVGTLQPRKNIERILQALQLLPTSIQNSYQILFVGRAGWLEKRVMQQMQVYIAKQQALWLQHIPFADLRAVYQAAVAILFPSLAEGFGMPILEGFASSTPVITSNFGATAEVAGQDAACLIDPYSPAAIRDAMVELINNNQFRDKLIANGNIRLQQFTITDFLHNTMQLYKTIV